MLDYFDYAATTPVDQRVIDKMLTCMGKEGVFANPASRHAMGLQAQSLVEEAREQVAAYLHADPSEIVWTSGATEADNLAIKGVAHLYERKGRHIITCKTEHKAVLDTCQQLEKEGYQVTYLTPKANGLIDLDELKAAITEQTLLVSLMHVNNETGVVQDIAAIGQITREAGVLFHVDAAQSIGKLVLNVQEVEVDLISMSAHKSYGPKGVGALYLRKKPRVRVQPLIHGGGHEQGMRSGTLPTHQLVGMGEAYDIARQDRFDEYQIITVLRDRLVEGLSDIPNFKLNTDLALTIPHILSVRFEGMLADVILEKLPNIAASTASACQGKGTEGSYVLRAMGLSAEQVKSAIRFSFGRYTTVEQIDRLIEQLRSIWA